MEQTLNYPFADQRPQAASLPPLREDIQLLAAPRNDDGSPAWSLHDPTRQQFFRIGWLEFEILCRWHLHRPEKIVEAVNRETTLKIYETEVLDFLLFLNSHHLTGKRDFRLLKRQFLRGQRQGFQHLRNILFVRIPLFRPDRFLDRTMDFVGFLRSGLFWCFMFIAALTGGVLTLRNIDLFQATFLHFFTPEGMLFYFLALIVVKSIHELAHAYTAKFQGLHVPRMGIALMIFLPVFYTDTTEAWKLRSRKGRLMIAASGMLAELSVAVLATLAWHFLPPGPMQSAAYLLAATSWLTTLLVNLNPFLRYDGYYLLADLLNVPNLQQQAFAVARNRLHRIFFGLDEKLHLPYSPQKITFLCLYAAATWIYRFFLFLGIAFLVYQLFFKLLGLLLAAYEIAVFIVQPILNEAATVWRKRSLLRFPLRLFSTFFLFLVIGYVCLQPWPVRILAPAVLHYQTMATIYPPFAGRIEQIHVAENDLFNADDVLFVLSSPELDFAEKQALADVRYQQLKLQQIRFMDEYADRIQIAQDELTEALVHLDGIRRQKSQLAIKAPWAGKILKIDKTVEKDVWVNAHQQLARIAQPADQILEVLLEENKFPRLKSLDSGASGFFYADAPEFEPIACRLTAVNTTPFTEFKTPALASIYGGAIPAFKKTNGKVIPVGTYYKLSFVPVESSSQVPQSLRGKIRLQGESMNLFERILPRIRAAFIRESGF